MLAAVLDQLPHAVLALDAQGRIVVANLRARALLARPSEALLGAVLWELVPGLAAGDVGRCCRQAVAAGQAQAVEAERPGLRGGFRIHAGAGPEGQLVLHARNVSTERRLATQVSELADRDALTGVANRRYFTERLARAVAQARAAPEAGGDGRAAVLLLDLDGFAAVNAERGHDAGDRLLRHVAERLGRAARGSDVVARVGADEFAVLLEGVAPDEEVAIGERLLGVLAAPVTPGDTPAANFGMEPPAREAGITACLAVVTVDGLVEADAVLDHAGLALERAKAAGRGRLARFTPALHAEVRARQDLGAALRGVLDGAPEHGAFSLAYQPVVDVRTGAPTGVEALLRWRHPVLGTVSPATFIPLAEELGLIGPIGEWVLREACAAIAGLDPDVSSDGSAAVPLTVAVNVSGHQLQAGNFATEVAAVLAASGLAPARLTVEVTETALVRDPRRARRVLGELRALGVRVAIDDFGTGYSSLGYLQQLPLDVLKIDKRFVDTVAQGSGPSVAIPRAIVALSGALGLRTVAEGVETAAQQAALVALGCGYGQGYLFARPLALPDLVAWLGARAWATPSPPGASGP